MPELFRLFGIRFENGDGDAKFQIKPIRLLSNNGMKNKDLSLRKVS
jgi:hypothetical protein